MKILCLGLLIVCCCLTGVVKGDAFTDDDPRRCLSEITYALENADPVSFERLVDLDVIIEQAVDHFLREASKPEIAAQLPPMLTLFFSQAVSEGKGGPLQSLMIMTARSFILDGVSSGAFGGRATNSNSTITPLFANASQGRKEICDIGEYRLYTLGDNSKNWLVPFKIHDIDNGRTYPIIGRIEQKDKTFRLIGVENLAELFLLLQREIGQME